MDKETFISFEKTAKFELAESEREDMLTAVNAFLRRFDGAAALDTECVAPLVSVLEDKKNELRADKARKLIGRDELLKGAPEASDGYFVVPKTVD